MKKKAITIAILTLMILSSFVILIPPVASDGGNVKTSRAADVMMVCDDVRGTPAGFWTAVSAVQSLGFSVQAYGTESAVPSNWNTMGYKAVFWHCGGRPPTYWQGASTTNQDKLVSFVQNGGHICYTGDSVHYAIGWKTTMRDYVGHYWFGAGSGGSGRYNYYTYRVTNPTHPVNTDPNVLPSTWTSNFNNLISYSPSFIVNNGKEIVDTPQLPSSYNMEVIVWEPAQDPRYPGGPYDNYGKTVYVRTSYIDSFGSTNRGNMITPFEQNVATWFLGPGGIPADVRLEPQSLNLDSNGNWVSLKVLGFPDNPEYTPRDVDGASCTVNGVSAYLKFGTWNDNKYIGKADRLLVEDAIGTPGDEVEVDINGKLNDGTSFAGIAIIKAL